MTKLRVFGLFVMANYCARSGHQRVLESRGCFTRLPYRLTGRQSQSGGYRGPEIGPTCIYFYDRADGRLVHAIGGLPDTTDHLAYSADGRYLAVALNHASGVRVYRSSDYAEVGRDAIYGDASTWVEFDRNGRLLTASDDGFVRAYDSRFHLTGRFEPPGGNWIQSARFSPDASKVAVGFTDSAAINVLSGRDLSFLYAPDTHFSNQSLGTHAGLVA